MEKPRSARPMSDIFLSFDSYYRWPLSIFLCVVRYSPVSYVLGVFFICLFFVFLIPTFDAYFPN